MRGVALKAFRFTKAFATSHKIRTKPPEIYQKGVRKMLWEVSADVSLMLSDDDLKPSVLPFGSNKAVHVKQSRTMRLPEDDALRWLHGSLPVGLRDQE